MPTLPGARLLAITVIALLAVACSSPPGGGPTAASGGGATQSPPPAGSPASTTPAATTAPATGPAATPGASNPSVDLALTGTLDLGVQGSAGECHIGHKADGTGVFEYFASPGDFPGIGDGLYLTETSIGGKPIIAAKVLPKEGPWFGDIDAGYQFSTDHRTLTIDTDLPTTPGKPEHLKGTIVCP